MSNLQDLAASNQQEKKKGIAYGAASLTGVLHGVGFPVTKEQVINMYGNKAVNYSKSNQKLMKDIIQKTNKEIFYTMAEIVEACSRRPFPKKY